MLIEVRDMVMGSGKSTGVINTIINEPENFYFCVLPYLKEVDRYMKECNPHLPSNNKLIDPSDDKSSKSEHLQEILDYNQGSVCTTHVMLESLDNEHLNSLRLLPCTNSKVLVLDETIDLVRPVNNSRLPIEAIRADLENEYIILNKDTGVIRWNKAKKLLDSHYPHHHYLKNLCDTGMLYYIDGSYLILEVPIDFLHCFNRIIILTYRWNNSIMANYLQSYNIHPELVEVDDERVLDVYKYIAKHLVIDDEITVDSISKGGMLNQDIGVVKDKLNRAIKEAMTKYDVGLEETLFTTFRTVGGEDMVEWLKTVKYGKWQKLDERGRVEPAAFLSHNTLGTNEYSHCRLMIYGLDKHIQPGISSYFSKKECVINGEGWALSVLLQWIFRGCIRDHSKNEDMYVVVLCPRMRKLLKDWLEGIKRQVLTEIVDKPKPVIQLSSEKSKQKRRKWNEWLERNPEGVCFTFEDYLEQGGPALKRRLKHLNKMKEKEKQKE